MAAYLIARITVTDPERYEDYKKLSPAAIAAYGGRFLCRGGEVTTLEGEEENSRIVLLEFPDKESAVKFYHSEQYAEAKKIRQQASSGQFIILNTPE